MSLPTLQPVQMGTLLPQIQQQQQPTLTNIQVGVATSTSGHKVLDAAAINRHAQNAAKTPGTFWKILQPSRTLKLSGAVNHVNRNWGNKVGSERFVYWPDYRVAGPVNAIYAAFRNAGVGQVSVGQLSQMTAGQAGQQTSQQPLSEATIAANSIDPLNPVHRQLLEQAVTVHKGTGEKAKPKIPFEVYLMIGNAIRSAKKASTTATTGGKAGVTTRVGRNPQLNLQKYVTRFNELMNQAVQGVQLGTGMEVSKFNPQKITGVKMDAPIPTKGQAIRPVISVGGRTIAVPVFAQPTAAEAFRAFAQTVIGQSPQYAQYRDVIVQAFEQGRMQRAGGVLPQQLPVTFAQPITGMLPSVTQQMPSVSQAPLNIMGQLGAPISVTSPTSGMGSPIGSTLMPQQFPTVGGVQLPTIGGTQFQQGGVQLPTIGGVQLPTVSGVQLPQVGGVQLPRVG